ncbi:MAG: MBL fold metallo-hydrolase [Promethearchaeia archaeon]
MMKEIVDNVYHVGDWGCSVYLVDTQSEDGYILIDCGLNIQLLEKLERNGLDSQKIKHCIITHFHIDHIGACADLKEVVPDVKFYAHEKDAIPIEEKGHDNKTAASWYGVNYQPIKLFKKLRGDEKSLQIGGHNFRCIHTPGHTPGSISVFVEISGKRILFGQDIHGPFRSSFGSDLKDYQKSMQKLLDLEADILCEGHFGVFQPAEEVKRYIKKHMAQNIP